LGACVCVAFGGVGFDCVLCVWVYWSCHFWFLLIICSKFVL
jgi:hypothetical protein